MSTAPSYPVETGVVIWMTGLPSAGKTTLAERVRSELASRRVACCVLDSDSVREALVPPPGYGPEQRASFYATLARLAAMMARQGLVTLVAATAHERAFRREARALAPRFLEVFIDVHADECARRDAKGLFRRFSEGTLVGLPGADLRYERSASPDVVARGGFDADAVARIVSLL